MALRAGDKGVNRKDLTPLSNRVKDLSDLDAYLTKDEASRTYLTLLQSEEFLTKLVAQATYQTIANMVNYQEKLVDGQSIKRLNGESLLGSGNISVLTQTIANTLYQTISGMSAYVKWEDLPDVPSLEDYVKKTDAVGYNDILTKTLAQSLYQTISGMSDYLSKLDAQSLYQVILQSGVNIKTLNGISLLGSGNISIPIASINSRLDDVEEEIVAINGTVSGINRTLALKMDTDVANASFMPINRIASASQLGGIKVGANLSIDNDGTLNAIGGGNTPLTVSGVINVTGSNSTGTSPTYRNVDIKYKASADYSVIMLNGAMECRGSGNNATCTLTTDFTIPNWNKGEVEIKSFPTHTSSNTNTSIVISASGSVSIKLISSTNFSWFYFLPIRLVLDDYV